MEIPAPSPHRAFFNASGPSRQNNVLGGTQNNSEGSGPQFPGANIRSFVFKDSGAQLNSLEECLAFPEIDIRFWGIDNAAHGTCEWLLRNETYMNWASSDRGLLWIKGKPGSGKSTLLRYVLEHATESAKTKEEALILSFFFHGRGTELQKTPMGLFRSLLYHLLRQVPDTLQDLVATFERHRQKQWHLRELQGYFKSSLLEVLKARPVWLFVDALDECGQENAAQLVEYFESILHAPSSDNSRQFLICFTCRHYPILNLDAAFEVCVEKENRKDISAFLENELSSFRSRTSSMIPDLITERADGVFLWACLIAKEVLKLERNGAGPKQIEDKIWSVPQKLDTLYLGLIQNMNSESLKLMQWIGFAMRPLSLDELRWAMIVDADCPHRSLNECESEGKYPSDSNGMKRRIWTLSHGLVEITLDMKVQFIHQSVDDFLVEKDLSTLDWPGKWVTSFVDQSAGKPKADFIVAASHYQLSRTCIHYLAMEEISRSAHRKSSDIMSEFPFLHYATTLWVAHTKQSDARGVPQDDILRYFAGPSNTIWEAWVQIYRRSRGCYDFYAPRRTSLLHVMLRHGLIVASLVILNKADEVGINVDEKDSEGRTPLMLAARIGNETIVRLLLDRSAHLEAADLGNRTPLSWATAPVRDTDIWIANDSHKPKKIKLLKAFLEHGKKRLMKAYRWRDSNDDTDLFVAEKGCEVVVRLLLDRGADVTTIDLNGITVLPRAVMKKNEAVVRLLLDWGADIEATGPKSLTPLLLAIRPGNKSIVQLLLDHGADHSAQDKAGRTPLSRAVVEGKDGAITQLLLDRGANLEAADTDGRTPLSWAAEYGTKDTVQILLDRGADLRVADNTGRTPLSWATGELSNVQILLDRGADLRVADNKGQTPLSWAARELYNEDTVQILLDRGADLEAADTDGRTPLSWAVTGDENEATVQLLLDRGADLRVADNKGRTSLSWAVTKDENEATVQLLLDRGANLEAADTSGRTPLSWAARELYNEDTVQILLDRGADLEAVDTYGRTPLSRVI